jgi:glycosyltransferase involved in cell wall biosynthesis
MRPPAVSVLLPAYNAERFVRPAIESVCAQTFPDFECLVLDDGSTDQTHSALKSIAAGDPRIRVISRENRGLVATLNELIGQARGRYLARMDADDLCAPHRFSNQVDFLDSHPECVAVGSNVDFIDPQDRRLKTLHLAPTHQGIVEGLLAGNGGSMIHPAVMIRATGMSAVNGYRPAFAGYGEDWDLFLRLSTQGTLANLPEILLQYRVHPQSYNRTRNASQLDALLRALNVVRSQHGLAPLETLPGTQPQISRAEVHRLWAEWAIEGAELRTARRHSLISVAYAPFRRVSWQFLKYSLSLPGGPVSS